MDFNPSPLNLGKFIVLKFEPIADVNAKRKQGNGYFGNNTAFVVFNVSIITPNIYNRTQHNILLYENPPLDAQGRVSAN